MAMAVGFTAMAQGSVNVSGRVADESGVPLPGATVSVEGTTTGTVTGGNGDFSLKVSSEDAVLLFESMGYKTVKMKVGKQRRFEIVLEEDTTFLDEVVVIGFGEQKKTDLTGSVATVKMTDVENAPTLAVDQAMQGRVAGADIVSVSGDPNEGTSIRIRGARSITAGNEPLIVVDGVMNAVQDLGELNSADIESISVLKDASSTAIYGAQGANGVIIVTTKAGSTVQTKATVTATAKLGFSSLARSLDVMNAQEFATYNNDRIDFSKSSTGMVYPATPSYTSKYADPEALGEGTDWVKAITRVAPFMEYALSVAGNNKKTNYFGSVSYADDEGIVLDSGNRRFTGRLNLSHRFADWIKLEYNVSALYRIANNNKANIGGSSIWSGAVYISPLLGTDSEVNDLYNYGQGQPFNNPYLSIVQSTNQRKTVSNTHTIALELTPIKGLVIKSRNTWYQYNSDLYKYLPGTLPARRLAASGGEVTRNTSAITQLNSDNTITYKTDFGKNHHLDVMGGMSVYYKGYEVHQIVGKGMLVDDLTWNNLSAIGDKDNYTITSSESEVKRMSFMGRVNYNYKKRYYLTFTGRADGSSNFAANNKWGFFPSAAFKWNAGNEPWIKRTRVFQELALRLSAGRTGNDALSPYKSLQQLSASTSGYLLGDGQATYYYPSRLDSPNLTWEKTDLYNAALDVAVLKGRLKFTLEGYLANTHDLLLDVQKAQQTGYSRYTQNLGRTSNKGVEFSLSTKNIVTKNFSWTTDFTISHNKQMVEDIGGESEVVAMNDPNKGYMIYGYRAGYPLNSLWGFQYGGVWHNTEEVEENDITHQYVDFYAKPYKAGRPRYVDQDHNGILDNQDLVFLGDADPIVYGGLQNNFHIFGFDLGVFFSYSVGGSIYNYSEFFMAGTYCSNQYRYMLNGWHPYRNPNSDIPAAGASGYSMLPSNFMVHDASFLRLKTVSLSYTFEMKKVKWMQSIRLGISADNIYLWTGYNGFDPDVSSKVEDQESTIRRADIGAYPRPRKIVGLIQIKF